MNPAALLFALQVLESLPALIAAGQSVVGLVQQSSEAVRRMVDEKRDPTTEEWDELNAITAALRGQLHSDQ